MHVGREAAQRNRSAGPATTLVAASLLVFAAAGFAEGLGDSLKRSEALQGTGDAVSYKFTPTYYHTTNQTPAWDTNLRANLGPHTAWVGYYLRSDEFRQFRAGYENAIELPFGHLTPSLQYATRGFLGGSLNLEIGERYFGLLGIGRTNLKDYFNLNFDPNDAILFGAGTRALPNTALSVFQIRDDRLGTGQRVTHLVARLKPDDRTRWTLDVFHKEGRTSDDDAMVRGTGMTVTFDYDRYFARVASDPHVNFTHDHMVRLSLGCRF